LSPLEKEDLLHVPVVPLKKGISYYCNTVCFKDPAGVYVELDSVAYHRLLSGPDPESISKWAPSPDYAVASRARGVVINLVCHFKPLCHFCVGRNLVTITYLLNKIFTKEKTLSQVLLLPSVWLKN
jgi:hypothetical protein